MHLSFSLMIGILFLFCHSDMEFLRWRLLIIYWFTQINVFILVFSSCTLWPSSTLFCSWEPSNDVEPNKSMRWDFSHSIRESYIFLIYLHITVTELYYTTICTTQLLVTFIFIVIKWLLDDENANSCQMFKYHFVSPNSVLLQWWTYDNVFWLVYCLPETSDTFSWILEEHHSLLSVYVMMSVHLFI